MPSNTSQVGGWFRENSMVVRRENLKDVRASQYPVEAVVQEVQETFVQMIAISCGRGGTFRPGDCFRLDGERALQYYQGYTPSFAKQQLA